LLNTIRSRCRRLDMAALDDVELEQAARQALENSDDNDLVVGDQEIEKLTGLSGGSVRRLLTLAAGGGADMQDQVWGLVASLPKMDWVRGHSLGDKLAPVAAADKFELFFNLLLDLIARLVRVRATGEGAKGELYLAARVIKDGQLASWAALWETVAAEKAEAMTLNLDRKTLILTTLARLQTAAR
jgi:DNA polymerase III subunit delta'